ncbi:MAG TPA: LamG-like jellyroll fold domain-containing protein [Streptosporangiaceae bacterium]|nr:LamG-like jellyroll fold domain-containing protein [Streptosporangiaceae bacterium]
MRLTAIMMLAWFPLALWAPAASASTLRFPALSLAGLRAWVLGLPSPHVPQEVKGSAAGKPHAVPASVTRAGRGVGRPPGIAPGQLPEYHPYVPKMKPIKSGPGAVGFNAETSRLVASATTATTDLYRNADGSHTRLVYAAPVNYRTASGTYAPIDPSLEQQDTRWREKANAIAVSTAAQASDQQVGRVSIRPGESVGWALASAAPVTASVSGQVATYSNVLPATDLVETAGRDGINQSLVLHSTAAPSAWLFPLRLTGLTAVAAADGSVDLVDAAGKVAEVIPPGSAADSRLSGNSGMTAQTSVTTQLVAYQGGQALSVSLSRAWLDAQSRVFPVTVSTLSPRGGPVSEGPDGANYAFSVGPENNFDASIMKVGNDGSGDVAISFIHFPSIPANLPDQHITSATLHVWDAWAWQCTGTAFNVDKITQGWTSNSTMTFPGPSIDNGNPMGTWSGIAPTNACNGSNNPPNPAFGGYMDVPMDSTGLSVLNDWTVNPGDQHGVAIRAFDNQQDKDWKQIDGVASNDNVPYFSINYVADVAPQINAQYPSDNYTATTLTPELMAVGSDPDEWPNPLEYEFTVEQDNNGTLTKVADSGLIQGYGGENDKADWEVPAGKLSWNQTYYWYVEAFDGVDYSQPTVYALTTPVPQPTVTSDLSQNPGGTGFDPANNNYTTSTTDARVSTVGPALDIERYYNSENADAGSAFGTGWSSVLDMEVSPGLSDISASTLETEVVTYPDGEQVGFGISGTAPNITYTAPEGRYATLTANGFDSSGNPTGFTLIDKNDTIYDFSKKLSTSLGNGPWGITSITDGLGNATVDTNDTNNQTVDFNWNNSTISPEITSMTSTVSGRYLDINWQSSTGTGATVPHVSSVVTSPVNSSDPTSGLTWNYQYSSTNGDELTSACPPTPPGTTPACTTYSYGQTGTTYPASVEDTAPHSFWPLDEPSGTTAHSTVLQNEGIDNGTYNGSVTLGQPGPVSGSNQTGASFDGSSADVELDGTSSQNSIVTGAKYQTVSLWFKVQTGNDGVLFSAQAGSLSSTTTTSYDPELYVGTDGLLHGEFWNGSIDALNSTKRVDDNTWHQAVLTSYDASGGDTQALYLDGQLQGSVTHAISNTAQQYIYIGAGLVGGGWQDIPSADVNSTDGLPWYFNGDIADVGFWDAPLNSSQVMTTYQAATTPVQLLTQITRPSGNVYAKVSYDPGDSRVTQVTDSNGGTWQIDAPIDVGSSQVYVSAVLGQGPADYWRLGDNGATDAANEVNGGTAVYHNVTENEPNGQFYDSPVATFDPKSSSNISLPSLIQPGGGANQSVSLWFNTTSTNEVLAGADEYPLGQENLQSNQYDPLLYIDSNGTLKGEFWNGSTNPISSGSTHVNDGKWHNVILAAGNDTQAMYLDGQQVAGLLSGDIDAQNVPNMYVGAGDLGGSWPSTSGDTGGPVYFNGSISDVAFYNSDLSQAQVMAEWNAVKHSGGTTPVEKVLVDPPVTSDIQPAMGDVTDYVMDPLNGNRLLSQTDAYENTTNYGYDTGGFLYDTVDPNGDETITGHDVRGNVVSQTTCQDQAANDCSTEYFGYLPDDTTTTLSPNPQDDLLSWSRAPGSSSATDNTYLTSYKYNTAGEELSATTPAVPGSPMGPKSTITYTTNTTTAFISPLPGANPPACNTNTNAPQGLPMTETSPSGGVMSIEYYCNGDVGQVTDADGLVTQYAYDGLGRLTTKTVTYDVGASPVTLTTQYRYNDLGQVTQETDPQVTDRVNGTIHQAQTTTVYDADGNIQSQTVADVGPGGGDASRMVHYRYDSTDHLQDSWDALGSETQYTYDHYGNLSQQTDPAGDAYDYTYNANGQLTGTTLQGYTGSPPGSQSPANLVESSRAYDPAGRLASVTDANGDMTSYTYTDNGLLATVTRCDQHAATATGCNAADGNAFVEQSNTYNGAGQLTQQATNNGATTTDYTPDASGQNTSQTVDPSGLDRTISYTYTPDGQVGNETLTGPGSSEPVQSQTSTYDPMGNLTSRTAYLQPDPAGNPTGWWPLNQTSGTTVTDTSGGGNNGTANSTVQWSGGTAAFNGTSSQVDTNGPVLNTAGSFSVSAWADVTGDTTQTQGIVAESSTYENGFRLQYENNGQWEFGRATADASGTPSFDVAAAPAHTGTWTHLVGIFAASSGTMTLYVNGQQAATETDTTDKPFTANGSLTIGADQWKGGTTDFFDGDIADVQVYQSALTPAQVLALSNEGQNGIARQANELATSWTLDQRGLPASMTDPNGNTTHYVYDEAGHLGITEHPAVTTVAYGSQPVQSTPTTMTGYNTFGQPTETSDADGNVTTTAYDADGQPVTVTGPAYTPPNTGSPITPVTTTTYNDLGQVQSVKDPLGNLTQYTYDQLGDVATKTDPDGGVTTYGYDPNGNQTYEQNPTQAVTDATYDYLGRKTTSTEIERYPCAAALQNIACPNNVPTPSAYTTDYSYFPDTNGKGPWLASQQTPDGVTTSYLYNAAGETVTATDGANNTSQYSYDPAGRLIQTLNPDGTLSTSTYNAVGEMVGQADLTGAGVPLRSDSATYDGDGNMVSSTDFRGHTTTYTYNAVNWLTSETQPVSPGTTIQTSFGYDPNGNQTLYVDGNGNDWSTTYNPWNLPEKSVEPATGGGGQPTSTTSYDAGGNPVQETEPGGVTLASTFNNMNELSGQSATGAQVVTATRSFSYDNAGKLTSAATTAANGAPATSESFAYDDRGLRLTASGSAGSSTFTYNGDGMLASAADAAGTTAYGYDNADRVYTVQDPLTGTTSTYTYNPMSQVRQISYGSGNDVRAFTYNNEHELATDTLSTATGTQVSSISYGYDPNGNLTSKSTTGFDGSSSNTYNYDQANRLTQWASGGNTVNYAYDGAGNRTQIGSETLTYNSLDELTTITPATGSATTLGYTQNGNLKSVTTGGTVQTFKNDGYGQADTQGRQQFTYDALGRVLTDRPVSGSGQSFTFSYQGSSNLIASDSQSDYTYDPSGTLVAAGQASGGSGTGVLALTDAHTDVVGEFSPSGAALSGSVTYDPLGNVLAASAMSGSLGYQSGFTDSSSGLVSMGARWYSPADGQFNNRDTAHVNPFPDPAAANPFAYAADAPLTNTDPTGHMAWSGNFNEGQRGACSGAACRWYNPNPQPRQQPSCGGWWNSFTCAVSSVYHAAVHHVVSFVTTTADVVGLGQALHDLGSLVGHAVADVKSMVRDASRFGSQVMADAWHAAKSASAGIAQAVTKYGSPIIHAVTRVVSVAVHPYAVVASAVVSFVKNHAAAIAGMAASFVVFAGCEAVLGGATAGVGAVAGAPVCGALAGAVGNAVSYGVTAAQTGKFSWGDLGKTALIGAVAGGVTGGLLGGAGGEAGSALADDLISSGADDAATTAADTAAASGARSSETAASADTADTAAADALKPEQSSSVEQEQAREAQQVEPSCGGMSFTAATRVVTASGKAVAISRLRKGQKVLATSIRTGETTVRSVAAVLVHYDTDRYNLRVQIPGGSAVIHTTRNHRFWDQTSDRWVKAAALKYGTRLRTLTGGIATAVGGHNAKTRSGWMWDLTIPTDHDFYVELAATAILVHNCPEDLEQIQEHVIPRHTPGGALADSSKGLFDVGVNLEKLAEGSAGRIGFWQEATSNIRYFIRTSSIVGRDISRGLPTNIYTIVRNGYSGDLVTMYPGLPRDIVGPQ